MINRVLSCNQAVIIVGHCNTITILKDGHLPSDTEPLCKSICESSGKSHEGSTLT